MGEFMAWAAPIVSTIIVTAATASINAHIKRRDQVADERHAETEAKRAAEAKWRDGVTKRLDEQDERIATILQAQCSQMRSDIIHKCHRYLDDLGKASTEEKEALKAEHDEYAAMCAANDIVNNFVDLMVQRVMDLPERTV